MEKYKKVMQTNTFEILAPTWNGEFELSVGSYYISDISDYFEYT